MEKLGNKLKIKKKLGVLGGSFDPAHKGHLAISKEAIKKFKLKSIYTIEKIRKEWSGDWQGKQEGDPFVVRGGYRCRHTWLPVADDFFD